MDEFTQVVSANEDWLIKRMHNCVTSRGYAKYTSTLEEAWRLSFRVLSALLIKEIEASKGIPAEFSPDDDFLNDPIASFGIVEAQRHRERGIDLGMFLSLLKYYRQVYVDAVSLGGFTPELQARYQSLVIRFYDRIEIGISLEWSKEGKDARVEELRATNRFLTNEKNRYLTLVESLDSPIFLLDAHNRLNNANLAAVRFLGKTGFPGKEYYCLGRDRRLEDSEGLTDAASDGCVANESISALLPWLAPELEAFVATEASEFRCEKQTSQDGQTRYFDVQLTRMQDISGKFTGGIVSLKDITGRKRAEDVLRESEIRYQTTLTAVNDGIWDWHVPSGKAYFSPIYYRLLGYDDQDFLASYATWLSLVHPEDIDRVEHDLRQAFEIGQGFIIELRMRTKGGGWKWVQSRGKAMEKDAEGKALRMVGTLSDITERKLAELALLESEKRLRLAQDAAKSGTWEWDMETGKNLWTNDVWKLYMLDPESNVASYETWLESIDPKDRPATTAAVRDATASGSDINAEWRVKTRDGSERWLMSRGQPQRDGQGNVVSYLGIVMDITERKRGEVAMLLAKEVAESANRAKSEFLANMSHEVRTPLNGILGMLQLLTTTSLDDEQKEYALTAITSSRRLTRLLSDILDLSRVEAGKMVLHEAEFEVENQKNSVMELFAVAARQKGLGLDFFIDERMPPALIGDKTRLRQILFNLVGNAIKFTDKGQVRVEASPLASPDGNRLQVLFTVADTGIGIPDDRIKDIFEPFVQVEGSFVRSRQGAGLGLAIVRKLVKLMGGDLSIGETNGGGTTMYLSLPFTLPSAKQGQVGQPADQAGQPQVVAPLRVLIAEDEEVSLIYGTRALEKLGHTVVVAKDGQQALLRLAEQDFDLILMDVQMPVMDGIESTKAIRTSTDFGAKANIPIIAMTAYAMAGDREQFLAAGMDGYIAKPVDMDELARVLSGIIQRS